MSRVPGTTEHNGQEFYNYYCPDCWDDNGVKTLMGLVFESDNKTLEGYYCPGSHQYSAPGKPKVYEGRTCDYFDDYYIVGGPLDG